MEFLDYFRQSLHLKPVDANTYSPLVLAYLGDSVYELMIRTRVTNRGLIHAIMEELSPEEEKIYKRGRNAKSASMAKHATMIDYRMATGFEALIGYLFLTEQYSRMVELVGKGLEFIGEFESE